MKIKTRKTSSCGGVGDGYPNRGKTCVVQHHPVADGR